MPDFFWQSILVIARNSETIAKVCAVAGGLLAFLAKAIPFIKGLIVRAPLRPLVKDERYLSQVIKQATFNYIEPNCQSVDPSGQEDFRKVVAAKQPAFEALDEILGSERDDRFTIVLADTGMGKTSLLLNYYSRHLRRRKQRFKVALVPLGQRRASQQIETIASQDETVLFLDALDEDTLAITDHRERLRQLLELAADFRNVVITCRTQFFNRDDEIPKETGLLRMGITRGGEDKEYTFHKLYLSPFSDKQVKKFVSKTFPFWRQRNRRKAQAIIDKMPDLTARPMLLAHVGDLINSASPAFTSADVYQEMVHAWLTRERHFADPSALLEFSEILAADVYLNRKERGSEKFPRQEAEAHAKELKFNLAGWQIAGRSLLNRDSEGNLKFSHRSFMEYLFMKYFLKCPEAVGRIDWTDQMKVFWWEMKFLSTEILAGAKQVVWDESRTYADITGFDKLVLPPVVGLRATAQKIDCEQLADYVQKMRHADGEQTMRRFWPQLYVRVPLTESERLNEMSNVVFDVVTGLMWEGTCSTRPLTFAEAQTHISRLQETSHAGFSDWRIPTVAEALSLLPTDPDAGPDTRPAVFSNLQSVAWTTDTIGQSGEHWRIDVNPGVLLDVRTCRRLEALRGPAYVRAVRTHAYRFRKHGLG